MPAKLKNGFFSLCRLFYIILYTNYQYAPAGYKPATMNRHRLKTCASMRCFIRSIILLVLFVFSTNAQAQTDSLSKKQKNSRLTIIGVSGGVAYAADMTALYYAWYAKFATSSFHTFDDDAEWLQMDKCGHTFTSYYEGVEGIRVLQWAGLSHKKATWIGGTLGLALQTPIEIMDGFSTGWGFSWGDMAANTAGTALVVGQELAWQDQIVQMKFSYLPSKYAQYRQNQLGSNHAERLIKDYNAQTYWLSFGLYHLVPKSKIPKWLNVAAGYGADGLLGARSNNWPDKGVGIPDFQRQRQYFLSLDIDLSKIKTKSKFVNTLLSGISFIKIPAPAIEFRENYFTKFHLLYF